MFGYTIFVKTKQCSQILNINGGNFMRIVNKKKFIKMVILIIGIISISFICFINISFSKGEIKTKTFALNHQNLLVAAHRITKYPLHSPLLNHHQVR